MDRARRIRGSLVRDGRRGAGLVRRRRRRTSRLPSIPVREARARAADVTRDVLAFLGEPWEEAVAAFDGEPGDFERVRRATGKESTTLQRLAQPLTGARVGVWRKALGPAEWAPVRAELGRRGYGEAVDRLTEETDAWLASADSTAP